MKLFILGLLLMLSGCSLQPVYVPVVKPCIKSPLPPRPPLPIRNLTRQSTPDTVIKAYVASVDVLSNYIDMVAELQEDGVK